MVDAVSKQANRRQATSKVVYMKCNCGKKQAVPMDGSANTLVLYIVAVKANELFIYYLNQQS